MSSETNAKPISIEDLKKVDCIDIELHFGIFFDGTNNQEVQVMIGKLYRRRKILSNLQDDINCERLDKQQLKRLEANGFIKRIDYSPKEYQELSLASSISHTTTFIEGIRKDEGGYHEYKVIADENNMMSLAGDKSFWEKKEGESRGILSQTDIDYLYFGYEEGDFVMEKHITSKVDNNMFIYSDNDLEDKHACEDNFIRQTADNIQGKGVCYDTKDLIVADKMNHPQEATYTNVALLEAFFNTRVEEGETKKTKKYYIPLYVEGSGTNAVLDEGVYSRFVSDVIQGQAFGKGKQGVLGKLTKMVNKVRDYAIAPRGAESVKIYYYVFGFSRGSTTARIFNYVVNSELKGKKLMRPLDPKTKLTLKNFIGKDHMLAGENDKIKEVQVKFLGLFDTVSSIGLNTLGVREHYQNIRNFHLYDTDKALYTFQIAAIDEVRANFALVDIDTSLKDGKGLEIFIPGCHTDIGGGTTIGMTEHSFAYNGKSLWETGIESKDKLKLIELNPNNLKESLRVLGWIEGNAKPGDKDYEYDSTYYSTDIFLKRFRQKKVILARRVSPGYSNMPLELMRLQAHNKGEENLFKDIQGSSYSIPKDLIKPMFSSIEKKLNEENKRLFCYPEIEQYRELRKNYITYSCEDGLVNPPSYASIKKDGKEYKLQARIIYEGVENSKLETAVTEKYNEINRFGQYASDAMIANSYLEHLDTVDSNLKYMFDLNGERVVVNDPKSSQK